MDRFQLMQTADNFLAKCFPTVEKTVRKLWYNRFHFQEPQMTKWGFKMAGEKEMIEARYEPPIESFFVKLLPRFDIFVNIGANIGYYSLLARQHGKKVMAFEPMPDNLKIFLRNIMSNTGFEDIEVFPIALADRIGVVEIFGGGTGASLTSGWAGVKDYMRSYVPVSTLDGTIGNRLGGKKALIMADMEGAEYKMLLKAEKALIAKPYWIIEISELTKQNSGERNPNTNNILRLFWEKGYRSYDIEKAVEITPDNLGKPFPQMNSYLGSGSNFFFFDKDEEIPS